MKKLFVVLMLMTVAAIVASAVTAAPSVPITKPPVQPVLSYTGPVQDPHAIQGQWFKDGDTSAETVRPYEVHDNRTDSGGGTRMKSLMPGDPVLEWGSTRAIYGKVVGVTRDQFTSYITGFTVRTVVTNDTPALTPWLRGENSHGEWTTAAPTDPLDPNDPINHPVYDERGQYVGTMYDSKLTVEFAISGLGNLPSSWVSPYGQGQVGSDAQNPNYIVAQDPDQLAWYCWTPDNPDPEKTPWGNFYVPTYDFGDIAPGQSVIRDLAFGTSNPSGIDPLDPRWAIIESSLGAEWHDGDIFLNRTTDLKIGDWVENMAKDLGDPYPLDPTKAGNVSLFHAVPEPGSLMVLGSGLAGLLGLGIRRRR